MIINLILFCLFVIWLLVPITPPTTYLDIQIRTDGMFAEVVANWPDNVDKGIPFVADMGSPEMPSTFPYKEVFDPTTLWRSVYFVRTDAYPLVWLQWWVVFRIEESRRLTELAIMYILATWGFTKCEAGKSPRLKDLLTK